MDTLPSLTLRLAVPDDVRAMFEIRTGVRENPLSREALAELGITPDTLPAMLQGSGRGWVACDGGHVLGFAMVDAEAATVFALFVRPGHEGRGIGRGLMGEAEDWLRAQSCAEAWLLTDADPKVRANGFYRHLGWQEDGLQEDGQVRFTKRLIPCVVPARL